MVNEGLLDVFKDWCGRDDLIHTFTYGVRIYTRESMLLNHIDQPNTHIISAVLQLDQNVDEGWPLEIILNATHRAEVSTRFLSH